MLEILEYLEAHGGRPFSTWLDGLDSEAAAKVTVAVIRLEQGNLSKVKSVGGGVVESRIDFGPGYRVYFGRDGSTVVILLGGGTKKRQQMDIKTARTRWAEYKHRKKEGER